MQYAAPPQPQLPPGWQMAYTAEGQVYYVDHNTQTTQWNPPVMPAYSRGPSMGNGGGRGMMGGRGRGGIDHQKRKTKICMNWENGNCSWGDRCAFAHGTGELQARQQQGGHHGGAHQHHGGHHAAHHHGQAQVPTQAPTQPQTTAPTAAVAPQTFAAPAQ